MLDEELVKDTKELLDEVLGASSPRVQAEILVIVSDTAAWLAQQVMEETSEIQNSLPRER